MILPPHQAVAALAAVAVAAGAWAAPAAQARVRTTCAARTTVFSTPGGLVVGFLARGTPLIVFKRTRTGVWADVRAVHSISGWIRTRDLC
jgi:hypothetical protein